MKGVGIMNIHYYDYDHDSKIPDFDRYKDCKGTICGYQRKQTTRNREEVTCKLCLREINKKNS